MSQHVFDHNVYNLWATGVTKQNLSRFPIHSPSAIGWPKQEVPPKITALVEPVLMCMAGQKN